MSKILFFFYSFQLFIRKTQNSIMVLCGEHGFQFSAAFLNYLNQSHSSNYRKTYSFDFGQYFYSLWELLLKGETQFHIIANLVNILLRLIRLNFGIFSSSSFSDNHGSSLISLLTSKMLWTCSIIETIDSLNFCFHEEMI